jgi:hypothetical protein
MDHETGTSSCGLAAVRSHSAGNKGLFSWHNFGIQVFIGHLLKPRAKPVKPPDNPKTAKHPINTGDFYLKNLA